MIPDTILKRLQATLRETDQEQRTTTNTRRAHLTKLHDYATGEQFGTRMQYWRGRTPKHRDKWDSVRKLAVQDDQIGPSLSRITDGILGRDPEWTLKHGENPTTSAILDEPDANTTPEARTTALHLQDLERVGTTWHKDADLHQTLKDAFYAALWAGTSSLRVYIPHEYATEATPGHPTNLAEALELIHVQAVDALTGGPIHDNHGRTIAHYYRYSSPDETGRLRPHIELHTPESIQHYRVELNELIPVGDEIPNPLYDPTKRRRPNYLMTTLTRANGTAITTSILDAQDALNIELTNMRRNSDMGGFRSVITLNAESPVNDKDEPAEWTLGPDVVVELRGVPTTVDDTTGEPTSISTPDVEIVDPVDPDVFLKGADAWKTQILEAFDQGHIVAKFQAVSGESKRQSRDDFDKRLITESGTASAALAWVIPTVLRLAAFLVSDREAASVHDLNCDPRLYLAVSQGSLELFKELAGVYKDGLVSRETVVEANPAVTDAQAELKRIDAERLSANSPPGRPPVEG